MVGSVMTTEKCEACGSRVVPRLVIRNHVPDKSYCPLCGSMMRDFNPDKHLPKGVVITIFVLTIPTIIGFFMVIMSR